VDNLTSPRAILAGDGVGWVTEPRIVDETVEVVLRATKNVKQSERARTWLS
jgi:hypothetical protein